MVFETSNDFGFYFESRVRAMCISKGLKVKKAPKRSQFDLEVNDMKVEVKASRISSDGRWKFNIHRHGVVTNRKVDFYILCLMDVPFNKHWIYVILPACRVDQKGKTIDISFKTLLTRYASDINAWKVFG